MLVCKCAFLDGTDVDVTIPADAKGSDLFLKLCKYLSIKNPDFLGLVFKDDFHDPVSRWWVNLEKPLKKQMKDKCKVWTFALAVKFYPKNNFIQLDSNTRRFAVIQTHEDLRSGRLPCPPNTLSILFAYSAQRTLGDYQSDEKDLELVESIGITNNNKKEYFWQDKFGFADEMIKIHKKLKNIKISEIEEKFLQLAASLPGYGSHMYRGCEAESDNDAKNILGPTASLGIGMDGFRVQKEDMAPRSHLWTAVQSFAYKRNFFIINFYSVSKATRISRLFFAFENSFQSKILWRFAVDMHVRFWSRNHVIKPDRADQVKISRKFVVFGKKQVKFGKRSISSSPMSRAKQHESSPVSLRRSRVSLHHRDDKDPKERLSAPSSPAAPTHSKAFLTTDPTSKRCASPLVKRTDSKKNELYKELFQKGNTASAVPRRLISPTRDDEMKDRFSDISDNTDVLCSRNIIEKTFSYAEKGGTSSIHNWLEMCSAGENRGRRLSRSAPPSQRSSSPYRSKSQLQARRDEIHPQAVHYAETDVTSGHMMWDDRQSEPDQMQWNKRFADIYKDEYLKNIRRSRSTQRRVRSMFSLAPSSNDRSARCARNESPHNDIETGSRHRAWTRHNEPLASRDARRYLSETRLSRAYDVGRGGGPSGGNREKNQQRRSFAEEDHLNLKDYTEEEDSEILVRDPWTENTIPSIPAFIRSVR